MPHKHSRNFEEFIGFIKERGFSPETIVDVGVCYGTPELQGGFPEAYHILIEPLEELEDRLKLLLKKYRGEYHLLALGSEAGNFPIAVSEAIEGATLVTKNAPKKNLRIIPVETLDNLFWRKKYCKPILLKTDCQGFDLDVIEGGKEFIKDVDIIIMEVNMFHPAGDKSKADFSQIVTSMYEHGFAVYDIISYQKRPSDGALGYIDLVFVKTEGHFRSSHNWGS